MNRFMIGQYGRFDYNKFRRDFKPGFYGIEACLFEREEDAEHLLKEAGDHGFRIGIHFPLRAGRYKHRDALLLSDDKGTREAAYADVEQELSYLRRLRPDYVLFHYPKPVIMDDRVDWTLWRFSDRSEYAWESEYSLETLREGSEQLFEWLDRKSREYDFTPVLELDGLNRYLYGTDLLESLLCRYPGIRLCLDTGRLYLQERVDPYFDAKAVLEAYAPYAKLIHLSNTNIAEGRVRFNHYPVHPAQKPEEGWAPMEDYLRIIAARNPAVQILFEHNSALISDEELAQCYEWVCELMNGISS
ncbi:Xylose isomerase-like TIM barrel [Paenibacillus konkukensis]|uniref:Xylose isomerase-like TIM barrel n=1 Tax=Paenibacillus konkukensis TaxID=2020716 RepID=A0ABY4RWT9_9BACL|nr:TIM barrel protein [Paenibacillus konkukensis]UQZ86826.1 Xylose isomerase-like TIM barrel [Paenibacillus konkukensis]